MWLGTNNGLSRFNTLTHKFTNYHKPDGVVNSEFNTEAGIRLKDGKILMGGNKGITAFYPNQINTDSMPLNVVFTGFYLFGKKVNIYKQDKGVAVHSKIIIKENNEFFMPVDIAYMNELELTYRQNYFSIEFSALNFKSKKNIQYKYMLKGIDNEWIYTENRRFATYNNLLPGKYEFWVTAANDDGIWCSAPTRLKLNIIPPFWMTRWFFLFLFLSIVLFVIALIKLRERKLKLQSRKLEKKVQKRTEEIRLKNIELKKQNEFIIQQKQEIAFQARQIKNELLAQNKESELALLRSQINPHFLFNTLNNINSLVFIDKQKTCEAILKLSEIMRYMHKDQDEFVPLKNELEYIKNYVDLQALRFKNEKFIQLNISVENTNLLVAPPHDFYFFY